MVSGGEKRPETSGQKGRENPPQRQVDPATAQKIGQQAVKGATNDKNKK